MPNTLRLIFPQTILYIYTSKEKINAKIDDVGLTED